MQFNDLLNVLLNEKIRGAETDVQAHEIQEKIEGSYYSA